MTQRVLRRLSESDQRAREQSDFIPVLEDNSSPKSPKPKVKKYHSVSAPPSRLQVYRVAIN